MKKVEEEPLLCPICLELPEGQIFQCTNGHTICHKCSSNVTNCPQCRVPFGEQKIRNRALEDLLGGMQISCKFKDDGCNAEMRRRELTNHLAACNFKPIGICKHMGLESCDFVSNQPTTLFRHFIVFHKKPSLCDMSYTGTMKGEFDAMKTGKGKWFFTSGIDIAGSPPRQFVDCNYMDINKQEYSFHMIHFSGTEDSPFQVTLRFFTPTKKCVWSWRGDVVNYKKIGYALENPPFKIPFSYFMDKMDDPDLKYEITITSK